MSEAAGEAPEAVELATFGGDTFSKLMDILVAEDEGAATGTASAEGSPAPGASAPAAADTHAATGGAGGGDSAGAAGAAITPTDPAPVAGAAAPGAGELADGSAAEPAAGGDNGGRPADWTAEPDTLVAQLGDLSTKFEERTQNTFKQAALAEVQQEHAQYFDALNQHPRLLVGKQVPAIGKEGTETLRDANDAREWQDAVKHLLVAEVNDRANKSLSGSQDFLENVHASIELFQNNTDLIPGVKTFDVELANRFTELVKPYELRVDGKLQGYSIPVQPIVNQVRAQLVAERAKAAPPASSGTPATPSPGAGGAAEAPQAGISSKAGHGDTPEDFSTLFGTIGPGFSNLQI